MIVTVLTRAVHKETELYFLIHCFTYNLNLSPSKYSPPLLIPCGRIKLKIPATQRHHRERAARSSWLVISKVRFLYGLPTYVT